MLPVAGGLRRPWQQHRPTGRPCSTHFGPEAIRLHPCTPTSSSSTWTSNTSSRGSCLAITTSSSRNSSSSSSRDAATGPCSMPTHAMRQQQLRPPNPGSQSTIQDQDLHPYSRRRALLSSGTLLAAAVGAALVQGAPAHAAPQPLPSIPPGSSGADLLARLTTPGDITQPGPAAPWDPKQLYYPRWLFGEWEVSSTFTGFRAPLGPGAVDPALLAAAQAPPEQGGLGSRYAFRLRFYSTLPDTFDNQLRVNLGLGAPLDAIIADTAWNSRAASDAYLGYPAVQEVTYDPRQDPGRATLVFANTSPDGRQLPPRRAELYINRLQSEEVADPVSGTPTFLTSTNQRQVVLGVRQVEVTDYEVLNSYTLQPDGTIACRQRTAIYLDPRQPAYFSARGRAVAVYDYDLTLTRVTPPGDAPPGAVACVMTPKDVIQCV